MARFGQYSQNNNDTNIQHNNLVEQLNKAFAGMVDIVYPIGSIYISVAPANPSTLFGGTWVAFGAGRTIVGVDATQTEFETVEKTGGHKLLQAHTHSVRTYGLSAAGSAVYNTGNGAGPYDIAGAALTTGGGDSENLQPYITVFCWKRTA